MVVDHKTKPEYCNLYFKDGITFDKLIKEAREEAGQESLEEELMFSLKDMNCEEFYFDSNNENLHISFIHGNNNSVFLEIPLSDEVLIDILGHAVKKFNKLKSVMESLK